MGLDIGLKVIESFKGIVFVFKIIFWNGLMGVFEFVNYVIGMKSIVEMVV